VKSTFSKIMADSRTLSKIAADFSKVRESKNASPAPENCASSMHLSAELDANIIATVR
jgi:hypothetical protein